MKRKHFAVALAVGGLALAACNEGTAPGGMVEGNASEADRQEILGVLDDSGFFSDEFGAVGAVATLPAFGVLPPPQVLASGAEAALIEPTSLWGRRFGGVLRRLITIDVDAVNGTAQVWKEIEFEGTFLLDLSNDGVINPTEKPIAQTLLQHAVFQRRAAEAVDEFGKRRRWRLVSASPAEFIMTDPAKRTVAINEVQVETNGALALDITDPGELLEADTRVPHLRIGDEVTVTAFAENTNPQQEPSLFVFLHVFHAGRDVQPWSRILMEAVEIDGRAAYVASFTVDGAGRERIAMDVIDSQTFATPSDDDYRATIWAVPYVIEGEPTTS